MEKLCTFDTLTQKKNADHAILLLHGYGASCGDLFPIAQLLSPLPLDWYVPDAPVALHYGNMVVGKSWFNLDVETLERARMSGASEKLKKMEFDGLREVAGSIADCVEELKKKYKKVFIAGFSQGSVVAYSAVFNRQLSVDGVVLFSTTIMHYDDICNNILEIPKTHFFQSHGESDPILPIELAKELNKLISKDHDVSFHSFSGAHEIPQEILSHFTQWLTQRIET